MILKPAVNNGLPAFIVSLTINGQLPSMKNQRRFVRNRHTGKPMFIKSKEALDYATYFNSQIPQKYRIEYDKPISLRARVHYRTKRSDLDIEYLKDLLQRCGIIKNDNQIHHMEAWKGVDKERPRLIFTIYPYEESK